MSGDQYLLHKLQLNYFISRNTDKSPRERADALISSMSQICVGRASHIVPAEAWSGIMQDLMKMYSATVDCSSEQGVNNYAECALTLSGSSAVDSNQWKSSLDEDDLNHAASHLMSSQLAAQEEATLRAQLSEAFSVKGKTCFASTGREKHEDDEIDTVNPSSRGAHNRSSRNNDTTDTTVQGEYLNIKHPNKSLRNYDVAHIPQNSNREDEKVRRLEANVESAERKWCHGNFKTKLSFNHPSHRTDGTKEEGIWAEDVIHGVREAASRAPLAKSETSSDLFRKKEGQNIWQNQSMKRKFDTSESNNQVDGTLPQKSGTSSAFGNFKTAKQQLALNNQTNNSRGKVPSALSYGTGRKVLGVSRKGRGLNSKFVPPVINDDPEGNQRTLPGTSSSSSSSSVKRSLVQEHSEQFDERLEGVDPKMVDLIMREIMDHGPAINWDDIAGLEYAKKTIKEIVVWPMLRPDIFYGLRGPPKGLLLFGPPGTGKTLIGKCIASQSNSTFFSISASSLTSKWVGEGEKMVRALFTVARCHQPAVIFIDEIDSLLSQRSTDEHESSRRIKTEFLIQLDGATSCDEDRLLVVGATNRPQEIDEAARRRLVKRLYIPLPDSSAREQIMLNLLSKHGNFEMSQNEVSLVCQKTDGYSGADVANLCREAALGPIRSINSASIRHVSAEEVRPITFQDFIQAVENVRPSVSQKDLELYLEWNKTYGSGKT